MNLNRASGLGAAGLGLWLLARVIPNHTESVDYGWLGPATLPNIAAVIVIISGGIHFIFPKGEARLDYVPAARAGIYLMAGILTLLLMAALGFVLTAPLFMLGIMLAVGERRWRWLAAGTIGLPAAIWFCVDFLLKRPLP